MKHVMLRLARAASAATALFVVSCASIMEPPATSEAPIRTDRDRYTVRSTEQGLEVKIAFTYVNRTGKTVFVTNCRGIAPPSLEKWDGSEWVHAWAPAVPLCLSPPIVIRPGETHTDTLHVVAGTPGGNVEPTFRVDEIEGSYRLVWHGVVHDYDANRQGFGNPLPLEERVSNVFKLER